MSPKLSAAIQDEQNHGRQKYGRGDDDFAHDDSHSQEDWFDFIRDHIERAACNRGMERRQYLIKVAGLVVSAIEAYDRKNGL